MSSGVDSSGTSALWSYVPFSQKPRRRSLPRPNNNTPWDPFEKGDRHINTPSSKLSPLRTAWMNQSQQARWIKAGGIVSLVILLYYFLSGSSSVPAVNGNVYSSDNSPTARCTKSHDPTKPLVQYAIMIDAGSQGSRIHVYKFNNCGSTPELENEDFKMTEAREGGSGLSSYKSDAEGAAKSLDMLLEVAMKNIPDEYKSCTPIAVKATAGLRKLGEEMSLKILDAVRTRLETVYPFAVVSRAKNGVEVMGGNDEGVYAWITTNYLLGKIGGPDKSPTAAILDLGGGSTQIVFQPTYPGAVDGGMPTKMAEGDHKYELDFGGRKFELYQHSHLGYGLMEARKATHRYLLEDMAQAHPGSLDWLSEPIPNPCIAPGMSREVEISFPEGHALAPSQTVTMQGLADALPARCRALTEGILYKDKTCTIAPCSFNGVHQPALEKTFSREDIYIFSYFYERTRELGMPESFTIKELHDLTEKVCGGEKHWGAFAGVTNALKELRDRPEWCLDLNFMLSLLHTGYEMPIDREVKIAKKIKGNEVGWCLGASLPLLEKNSGWECRIKEVS